MRGRVTAAERDWLIVGGAFLVLALVASVWLAIDRQPPDWDHANHLERAVLCGRDLAASRITEVIERSSFYPPVVPCLAGVLAYVVRSDLVAAQMVMAAFLALGMVSLHALGRERLGGRAGLMGAIIFGAAPFVVFNTVRFQLDLPLAAVVAFAIWLVVKTNGFSRVGWTIAFGVVVGVGLLVKPPFPVYVAPAVVWALTGARTRRRLANVALAAVSAIAVSVAWYGPRLMGLPTQIANRSFKQAAESGHPSPWSWTGLSFYPVTLPMFFGAAAAILLIVGLVVAWRRRRWLEFVSVLVPFACFLMIQNKNARYTLPILPMASLVAALALDALPARVRTIATAATLVVTAVQVTGTAFAFPPKLGIPGTLLAAAIPAPPSAGDWRHDEIFEAIAGDAGGSDMPATVSIVPNHASFSTSNFRYYAVRDARPLRILRAWDEVPIGIHYMVLKTGDVGPPWTEAKSRRATARVTEDPTLSRAYPVLAEFPLPDGSIATVRARDLGAGVDGTPEAMAEGLAASVRRALEDFTRDVAGLDVRVEHEPTILRGRVRRLEITATRATIGELKKRDAARLTVRDLRMVVDDLLFNPWSVRSGGRFEPLDARRVWIAGATIGASELQSFLAELKGFTQTTVRLEPGAMWFAVGLPGPDVSARVRVAPGQPFELDADDVRLGGMRVPGAVVGWVFRAIDPSTRLAARLAVPVEITRVRIGPDAIRIGE